MPLPNGTAPTAPAGFSRIAAVAAAVAEQEHDAVLASTYETVADVFQSWFHRSKRLRMPRLNWSEYGVFRSLLIRLTSRAEVRVRRDQRLEVGAIE